MRKLTTAELEAELQVGTVDLSEIELVMPLDQPIEEFMRAVEVLATETLDPPKVSITPNEPITAKMETQAKKARATKKADTRAAKAVADADQVAATSSDEQPFSEPASSLGQ